MAKTILGSFVFLTTRHTWNKAAREQGKLLLPETELYELLTVVRRRLITWPRFQRQGDLDLVLQTALQVSSSSTGSLRASAAIVDAANRWSVIGGPTGRFAVASTRTVKEVAGQGAGGTAGAVAAIAATAAADDDDDDDDLGPMPMEPIPLGRQASSDAAVEEIADTGQFWSNIYSFCC